MPKRGDSLVTGDQGGADDNASTRAVRSGANTPAPTHSAKESSVGIGKNGLPTIRISTESNRERERAKSEEQEQNDNGVEGVEEADGGKVEEPQPETSKENGVKVDQLEKPSQAGIQDAPNPSQEAFSFSNKRLCERWLDNLFMVLYEVSSIYHCSVIHLLTFSQDLRVWTIFRAEVAHFKTQHIAYRKTGSEWEILGDLGLRLHHKEEAKEAYQRCLDGTRYSFKPWSKLLDMYSDEGDIQRTLQVAVRVAAYQYAEYAEMTVSSLFTLDLIPLPLAHSSVETCPLRRWLVFSIFGFKHMRLTERRTDTKYLPSFYFHHHNSTRLK